MLLGADSGVSVVVVRALELVKRACLAQISLVVAGGGGGLVVEVHAHHVLEVVAAGAELGAVGDAPAGGLLEHLLVLGNETFRGLVVKASQNLVLEALRSVVRVALSIEVLRVDTRDEAGIAWDALVADVVHGAVHPGTAGLAHVAAHAGALALLIAAVDGVRSHRARNLLLLHDGRGSVDHGGLVNVAEVLTGLAVCLAGGLPNDVELHGDVARVPRNLLTALHL